VHALRKVLAAVVTGGVVLDLQAVRPPPRIEAAGIVQGELDSTAFFQRADANDLWLERAVAEGALTLEAEDHHHVLTRWSSGAALIEDVEGWRRGVPQSMKASLRAMDGECVLWEPCRLRRFRVPERSR